MVLLRSGFLNILMINCKVFNHNHYNFAAIPKSLIFLRVRMFVLCTWIKYIVFLNRSSSTRMGVVVYKKKSCFKSWTVLFCNKPHWFKKQIHLRWSHIRAGRFVQQHISWILRIHDSLVNSRYCNGYLLFTATGWLGNVLLWNKTFTNSSERQKGN